MANELSESAWTGFLKKQKLELDDGALRKALAKFDKADEGKAQARVDALKDVVEQLNKQVVAQARRKKELGDKPFALVKDQLHTLLGQAEALQKKAQAAAAEAEEADEEADTPVLLTTKMVPLLRELRKGLAQMHAMVCTAGKNTAVLIMRKPIGPSRRKLLADAVDAKGGMKYIVGECVFEDKALTFIVKSPAAQLAKRLRQALLDQTDLRFKVRVRGEDGVEEDGEDEGEDGGAAAKAGSGAPQEQQPASAAQLAYTQRLGKVSERYEQALRDKHPESTKLRALMGFASEKADGAGDYAAAAKALETIEKLLEAARPQTADAMANWTTQRAAALTTLKELASKIAGAKHASSAKAIVEIQIVVKNLTAQPASLQQVTELQRYIGSDDIVNDVCELAKDIRTPLLGALSQLRAALAA